MKLVIAYVLIGFLAFFSLNQYFSMRELKANQVTGMQPAEYHLPDDVVTIAQMDAHIMKAIHRVGPDSVFISETYVPSETSVEYIVRVDTIAMGDLEEAQRLLARLELEMGTANDSIAVQELRESIEALRAAIVVTEIDFSSHGLCMVPEAGVAIDSDLGMNIEVGARLYYWNRFGIGVHGLAKIPIEDNDEWTGAVGIFVDWRTPWDNFALSGGLEHDFGTNELQASAGGHVYFK